MNDLDSRATRVVRSSSSSPNRRQFLAQIRGGAGAAALASSAVSFGSAAQAHQESSGSTVGADRVLDSYQLRVDAARAEASIPVPKQIANGDEQNYPNYFIGNFHKGLPHNNLGEVMPNAYRDLLEALGQGTAKALEKKVTLGGTTKLVNCL